MTPDLRRLRRCLYCSKVLTLANQGAYCDVWCNQLRVKQIMSEGREEE